MATTNVVSSISKTCFVVRKGSELKVIGPDRVKSLTLNLNLVNMAGRKTEEESALLERLVDGLLDNIEDRVDLTMSEMRMLVAIRDKSNGITNGSTSNGTVHKAIAATPTLPVEAITATTETLAQKAIALTNRQTPYGIAPVDSASAEIHKHHRALHVLQSTAKIWQEQHWTIDYDVSTYLSQHPDLSKRVDNPCKLWRKIMIKDTLSKHLARQSILALPVVAGWIAHARKQGATVLVRKVHADDMEDVRYESLNTMRKYIVGLHTSLITNISNADQTMGEKLREIEGTAKDTEKGRRAIEVARFGKIRTNIQEIAVELTDAINMAEQYDMTEDVEDLFKGLEVAIRTAERAFRIEAVNAKVSPASISI